MEAGEESDSKSKDMQGYDPGWNDPPMLSFGTTQATTGPPKRGNLLNKRVAFPLCPGSSQPTSGVSSALLPPLPAAPPLTSPHGPAKREDEGSEVGRKLSIFHMEVPADLSKEEALQKVMGNFEEVMKNMPEDQKKKEEIWRRLGIMKKMWEDDQLGPQVCGRLFHLSDALVTGNGVLADQIHIALMVDHVAVCSQWMAGVRHLIHHVESREESSSIAEEEVFEQDS